MKLPGALAALLLAGCTAGPQLHVGNQLANFGQGLPDSMLNTHLTAIVGFDEDYAGRYPRVAHNVLYVQGIVAGTPEYQYRVARLNLGNLKGTLIYADGEMLVMTGGIVPDHLPRLRAGDVVELRQTGTWRTMENFASKKEGNVVTRILCRKADAGFEACVDRLPRVGKYEAQGPTGSAYPVSVSGYGFSFTQAYSAAGVLVRPLP